jgi:hypothetical protein
MADHVFRRNRFHILEHGAAIGRMKPALGRRSLRRGPTVLRNAPAGSIVGLPRKRPARRRDHVARIVSGFLHLRGGDVGAGNFRGTKCAGWRVPSTAPGQPGLTHDIQPPSSTAAFLSPRPLQQPPQARGPSACRHHRRPPVSASMPYAEERQRFDFRKWMPARFPRSCFPERSSSDARRPLPGAQHVVPQPRLVSSGKTTVDRPVFIFQVQLNSMQSIRNESHAPCRNNDNRIQCSHLFPNVEKIQPSSPP